MVAPVSLGDILADKYRVEHILGVGGMGVVVAAKHIELGQKVALKFMLPAMLENQEAVERFLREARAAVQLRSEHVARVIDVGRLKNNAPYIVMEFLEGEDLYDLVRENAPYPAHTAVDYVLQACLAMAEAHSAGIVHRDLKPANLFLARRPDGSPLLKVLDFGVAKLLEDQSVSQTKTAVALGSPAYMAPEQMRSAKHVDKRADIWSLGAILYQLLSGSLPFEADSPPEMFALVLGSAPTPILSVIPDIDEELAKVVHLCLKKDRSDRYASVSQLARALVPFGDENAAKLASSVAKVESDTSEIEDGGDSERALARPDTMHVVVSAAGTAQTVANRKVSTITTRSGSAGVIRGDSGSLVLPEPGSRKNTYVLGGAGVALALFVSFIVLRSGDSESSHDDPEISLEEAAADQASTVIPTNTVPPSEALTKVELDAGTADARTADANVKPAHGKLEAKTAAKAKAKGKSSKATRTLPVEPKKVTPTPPKKKIPADPFSTMQ